MRQMIDNIRPIPITIAAILMVLSFFFTGIGHIWTIYTTILLGSLFFFDVLMSVMIIAPALSFITALAIFSYNSSVSNYFDGDNCLFIELYLFFMMVLIGAVIMLFNHFRLLHKLKKYPEITNDLSDNELHFNDEKLQESNLQDEDLTFFKDKMRRYYKDYRYLQSVKDTMDHTVDSYDTDLTIVHAIFNELATSPRMLLKMDHFLYSHLEDYTAKVKAIMDLDDNVIKSDEDQELIDNAKKELAKISRQFRDDFIQVTEDEREALKK